MTSATTGPASASFELKFAQQSLLTLIVRTPELGTLASDLAQRFGPGGDSPDFFDHDGVVIDFSHLAPSSDAQGLELPDLLALLRAYRLVPVAVQGADEATQQAALAEGLFIASEVPAPAPRKAVAAPVPSAPEPVPAAAPVAASPVPTLVIDRPLRSGQKAYAKGGDLVVLAMVNQGAEVAADGNIHVYAPLRGKAMAGARGNTDARIFSICLEPELISIAGIYRTSENPLPADVQGKPAQVRLGGVDGDKLLIEPLKS